ncbi:hypothetical protein PC129_g20590 [Phytophthora cactorum]|uniref:Uncharacterized protein n=1 Tax=Phytophthora cactorum TaxID=29920 RepID=A0A8T1H7U9_9STRA|nr:hypothetical protein PC129_g20590 [Phytophthora cactorum]
MQDQQKPPSFPNLPKSARSVFQARSVPAVMAVVNKKLSEAVAAGEGAKHNIEVEETEGQSDDDSDDTMTAGFWKTHIFKKRVSSAHRGQFCHVVV